MVHLYIFKAMNGNITINKIYLCGIFFLGKNINKGKASNLKDTFKLNFELNMYYV